VKEAGRACEGRRDRRHTNSDVGTAGLEDARSADVVDCLEVGTHTDALGVCYGAGGCGCDGVGEARDCAGREEVDEGLGSYDAGEGEDRSEVFHPGDLGRGIRGAPGVEIR
jgi:hypothetical protein